ncbi:hypothetical protein BFN03_16275 [Rhodococcus sp. WMMA185]|uniref:hypothetical protein n=1 Tax=Rhodococcus sp. WMMA185 TaxID=679318 RepID=UPI000878051C|nr:hypothetical protein [Rhodococcus sp. WMMA185]AOW93677.1 hypothetical protein BFN03_16275 [Rhodococcus sp. WMMA185]
MHETISAPERESARVQPSTKDRRDLWTWLSAFGLLALLVIARYLYTLLSQLGAHTVTARMDLGAASPSVPISNGSVAVIDGPVTVTLRTDGLSPVTTALLRAGDAIQTASYLVVLTLIALLVYRVVRGEIFSRAASRLTYHLSRWVVLVVVVAPTIPKTIGTNLAIRDSGLGDSAAAANATLDTEFWFIAAASIVLSAMAIVLRLGTRMARDQEGLI